MYFSWLNKKCMVIDLLLFNLLKQLLRIMTLNEHTRSGAKVPGVKCELKRGASKGKGDWWPFIKLSTGRSIKRLIPTKIYKIKFNISIESLNSVYMAVSLLQVI